jgi:TatD DNase family protein
MRLIDSHCHFASALAHDGGQTWLAQAREAGVDRMITIGTGSDDWTLYRALAAREPDSIAYTAGLHPCSVDETWEAEVARLEAFHPAQSDPAPVALGEVGLDYFHLPKDREEAARQIDWQKAAFAAQLSLAATWDRPIVVHSRGAFSDCLTMIDASGFDWQRVVFHCFTEGPEAVKQLNDRGGRASFTGIITYKNAEAICAALQAQGPKRLMVETDSPYLTPVPQRGKPNHPALVKAIATRAALLLAMPLDELAAITTANTCAFFSLPS